MNCRRRWHYGSGTVRNPIKDGIAPYVQPFIMDNWIAVRCDHCKEIEGLVQPTSVRRSSHDLVQMLQEFEKKHLKCGDQKAQNPVVSPEKSVAPKKRASK